MEDKQFDEAIKKLEGAQEVIFQKTNATFELESRTLGSVVRMTPLIENNIFFPENGREILSRVKDALSLFRQHLLNYRASLTHYYVDLVNGVNDEDMDLFKQAINKAKERDQNYSNHKMFRTDSEELRTVQYEVNNEEIKSGLLAVIQDLEFLADDIDEIIKLDKELIEESVEIIEKFLKG